MNVLTRIPVESIDRVDDDDGDFDDWYCITDPPGICACCGINSKHIHVMLDYTIGGYRIVVWPSNTDKMILKVAAKAKALGYDPKIIPYEQSMGKCISFYKLPR